MSDSIENKILAKVKSADVVLYSLLVILFRMVVEIQSIKHWSASRRRDC